ncbi:MAG: helix-turn-helix transcriptional regulator [Marmoricola sp.]
MAGLTQVALAERAGVTQSVISAYESGAREPSLTTLERLISATGLRLELMLRRPREPNRLRGPLGRRLVDQHAHVLAKAAEHGASNVRVFGSVARSDEDAE